MEKNTEALNAYIEIQEKAKRRIKMFETYLENHQNAFAPEEINWGHVGDIGKAIAGLNDILGIEEIEKEV